MTGAWPPNDDPEPPTPRPDPDAVPEPPPTPGEGSTSPGGSPLESPGVESPLKD